ncbi:hypothetical protein ScPMuIL_002204 [Solemya velum]
MGKCCSKFKYVDRRRVSTGDSSGGGDDTLHSSSRDTSHEQPEEATSEVKPEVESKKVSAGEEEREKSTKEKVTQKDEPCEHKSQEHSDEQKDSCEDNYKPESEAEVKDTSKADENRKNKTEEAKRKKNEAADRKNYEKQVESKVVEPSSEQIEAVTKIQGGTQLKSLRAKPDEVEDEATPATTIVISPDGVMRGACNVIENVQTGGNIVAAPVKLNIYADQMMIGDGNILQTGDNKTSLLTDKTKAEMQFWEEKRKRDVFHEKEFSDDWTNFWGANSELKKSIEELSEKDIAAYALQKNIDWHFNPLMLPTRGGWWEHMIGCASR